MLLVCLCAYKTHTKVTIIDLPKGELKWSKTRPSFAKLCVPAAFSSTKNTAKINVHTKREEKTKLQNILPQTDRKIITKSMVMGMAIIKESQVFSTDGIISPKET